jgi:hypothetical protein
MGLIPAERTSLFAVDPCRSCTLSHSFLGPILQVYICMLYIKLPLDVRSGPRARRSRVHVQDRICTQPRKATSFLKARRGSLSKHEGDSAI